MTVIIVHSALLRVPSEALVDGRGEEISCDGRGSAVRLPLAVLQDSYQTTLASFLLGSSSKFGNLIMRLLLINFDDIRY